MDKLIMNDYMEAYKKLDKLCKEIFYSEKGVSSYIEEMENESRWGERYVLGWNEIYKKLKHYRWVRNQYAHEVDALDRIDINVHDIEWLENFTQMIMERKDPFSKLREYKEERIAKKNSKYNNDTKYDLKDSQYNQINIQYDLKDIQYHSGNTQYNKKKITGQLIMATIVTIIIIAIICICTK